MVAVAAAAAAVAAAGAAPLALGGDHSVTFPLLRGLRRGRETRAPGTVAAEGLTIVHFDAHPDTYEWRAFDGNPWSHAAPFARAAEEGLCTRLVQLGVRCMTPHLRAQADALGRRLGAPVEAHGMLALSRGGGLEAAARALGEGVEGPVYVSFDLDVLDPAHAPGVSHWEPGGLAAADALALLAALAGNERARVVGADLVEYNPRRDRYAEGDAVGMTAMVAGKLAKELAAMMLLRR